jgi:type IV pilus assembly protein PilA
MDSGGETMRKDDRGFSLIELLIVVAIILIIAAIAIPNLLKSRIAASQASAVGSLHTLNAVETMYASTYNTGFSPTLSCLGPGAGGASGPSAAGMIDSGLAGNGNTSTRQGYRFIYSATPDSAGRYETYTITAEPITPGTTGTAYFYTDQSGVIRQNSTGPASASDPPVGG